MDDRTARRLSQLTSAFYARVADSFSATRQRPWPGWQQVLCETDLLRSERPRVLDVACGNLRFERYLAEERLRAGLPRGLRVRAFDGCDELARALPVRGADVTYAHLDVTELLLQGGDLSAALGAQVCDVAVCLAFLHHLPLPVQRERLLRALVDSVVPGGCVVVSFWQLSRSERLLAKAQQTTELVARELGLSGLGPGDYLLGWQGRTDVVRYCHDFAETEVDELLAAAGPRARETARFSADGATGDMNRYLVLRVAHTGEAGRVCSLPEKI